MSGDDATAADAFKLLMHSQDLAAKAGDVILELGVAAFEVVVFSADDLRVIVGHRSAPLVSIMGVCRITARSSIARR
ncbi:MAG: hypothetical protein H7236_13625, partial [Gemmatimonadaceae bacterium]|nr:hypothetical protein [Caulobacter sp.]